MERCKSDLHPQLEAEGAETLQAAGRAVRSEERRVGKEC